MGKMEWGEVVDHLTRMKNTLRAFERADEVVSQIVKMQSAVKEQHDRLNKIVEEIKESDKRRKVANSKAIDGEKKAEARIKAAEEAHVTRVSELNSEYRKKASELKEKYEKESSVVSADISEKKGQLKELSARFEDLNLKVRNQEANLDKLKKRVAAL